MTRINLPPGAYGISIADYKSKRVKPGGSINVDDPKIVKMIRESSNAQLGIISGQELVAIKTKNGRWCEPCHFLAQAWSKACPRCGGETVPESS